jgi:hypothetical protein
MDIWLVILIVVAIVLMLLAAGSPTIRRQQDAKEIERGGVDMDRQFKRPPNEGDLL